MTLSDPEPRFPSHSIVWKRISRKRCIRSTYVWFQARVFGLGGSNGVICGSIKSKMAVDGDLGYTEMAITSQPVCRSTWCLVLGRGFRLSLDLYHRGLHACTAVARNPLRQLDFLVFLTVWYCCITWWYVQRTPQLYVCLSVFIMLTRGTCYI